VVFLSVRRGTVGKDAGRPRSNHLANGNTNGILWGINGPYLYAFDATTLKMLYNTNQAGARDQLPTTAHFRHSDRGQRQSLRWNKARLDGLRPAASIEAYFRQQSDCDRKIQPCQLRCKSKLQILTRDRRFPEVTITFSDGGKGGVFGNPTAITDSQGSLDHLFVLQSCAYGDHYRFQSWLGKCTFHRDGNTGRTEVVGHQFREQSKCSG